MKYEQYIQSDAWRLQRQLLIAEHGAKCDLCKRTNELNVHHLNYERLGNERADDVIVLCIRCHNDIHYAMRKYPASEKALKKAIIISEEDYSGKCINFRTNGSI